MGIIQTFQSTALLLLPVFWTATGATLAQDSRVAKRRDRGTLVKVLDSEGKAVAGASVVFLSAPMHGRQALVRQERIVVETDKNGRARAKLSRGRSWAAWAAWDGPNGRLTSKLKFPVTRGRPLRLTVETFPVSKVRVVNLKQWRKVIPSGLSLAFISDGDHSTIFKRELGKEKEPVFKLPPLPHGNYFPTLLGPRGEFLDTIYFNHQFYTGQPDAEELYERDVPLKRFVLGRPIKINARVVDANKKAVGGAWCDLGPASSIIPNPLLNTFKVGADGKFVCIVPWKPEGQRGRYDSVLHLFAPGYVPQMLPITFPWQPVTQGVVQPGGLPGAPPLDKKKKKVRAVQDVIDLEVTLVKGQELDWRLTNALENDLAPGSLYLRTNAYSFVNGTVLNRVQRYFPVSVGKDSRLQLPGLVDESAESHPVWELFLVRAGQTSSIYFHGRGTLPVKVEIDLASLRRTEFSLLPESGSKTTGGEIFLFRLDYDGLAKAQTFGVDRSGRVTTFLMPGKYIVVGKSEKQGDGYHEFALSNDETKAKIHIPLRPYKLLVGTLVDDDDKPLAKASLSISFNVGPKLHPFVRRALINQNFTLLTDKDGSFSSYVSKLAGTATMSAYLDIGGSYIVGHAVVEPDDEKKVKIVLSR